MAEPFNEIFLVAEKWRGSIAISSMKYFTSLDEIKTWVASTPAPPNLGWGWTFAWRVPRNGLGEAKILSKAEMQAVGLR